MITVLVVCAVVVSIAVVIAVIYFIQTLIQIRCASREAEIFMRNLNREMGGLVRITDGISSFLNSFNSPWMKAGSWITGMVSSLLKNKKRGSEKTSGQEEVCEQ